MIHLRAPLICQPPGDWSRCEHLDTLRRDRSQPSIEPLSSHFGAIVHRPELRQGIAAVFGADRTVPSGGSAAPSAPTPTQRAFIDFQPAPFMTPFNKRCLGTGSAAPAVGALSPACLLV